MGCHAIAVTLARVPQPRSVTPTVLSSPVSGRSARPGGRWARRPTSASSTTAITGYPPVVGWSASMTTGWPSGGTWMAPVTRPSLGSSCRCGRRVSGGPLRRMPTLDVEATVQSVRSAASRASSANQSAGAHAQMRTTVVCSEGGRGAWSVATGVAGSRPAPSTSPGCGRWRAELRQAVPAPRAEHRLRVEAPAHGEVGPRAPPAAGSTAIVSPGRQRPHRAGRRVGDDHRGDRLEHEPAGGLEHGGVGRLPTSRLTRSALRAIHRPGTRHAEVGVPRPPAILERRRHPGADDPQHRSPRSGRHACHSPFWAGFVPDPSRRSRPDRAEADGGAGRDQRRRVGAEVPQRRRRCGRAGANRPATPTGTPPCTARRSPPTRPAPTSAGSPAAAAAASDRARTGRRTRARTHRSRSGTTHPSGGRPRRRRSSPAAAATSARSSPS